MLHRGRDASLFVSDSEDISQMEALIAYIGIVYVCWRGNTKQSCTRTSPFPSFGNGRVDTIVCLKSLHSHSNIFSCQHGTLASHY